MPADFHALPSDFRPAWMSEEQGEEIAVESALEAAAAGQSLSTPGVRAGGRDPDEGTPMPTSGEIRRYGVIPELLAGPQQTKPPALCVAKSAVVEAV